MSNQQYELNEISLSYKPKWFMVQKTGITSSRNVFDILVKLFSEDTIAVAEQCVVLFLNHGGKILGSYQLSSGGMTGTIMDVRLILSIALKSLASGIILSHNHPSGSLKPSRADIALTIKIQEAARIMDIKVLDHIILTPEREYFSFADEGLL